MITVKVKKIYLDHLVSIRDYIVREAIKNNEPIKVVHDDAFMIIPVERLNDWTTDGMKHQSHQRGSKVDEYRLFDYEWVPDVEQVGIFDAPKPKKKLIPYFERDPAIHTNEGNKILLETWKKLKESQKLKNSPSWDRVHKSI